MCQAEVRVKVESNTLTRSEWGGQRLKYTDTLTRGRGAGEEREEGRRQVRKRGGKHRGEITAADRGRQTCNKGEGENRGKNTGDTERTQEGVEIKT